MELKEYIKILRKNLKLFVSIIILFIFLIPAFFLFQPTHYQVSLNLDITRAGSQNSQDYQFDDFYRLQADEKFADTIVEWLRSPSVNARIWKEAYKQENNLTLKKLSNLFRADKVSSQVVLINFSVSHKEDAKLLSESIIKIIRENTKELNQHQARDNWFEIIARGPIIKQATYNYLLIIPLAFIIGIFVAFWIVLFKHYLE